LAEIGLSTEFLPIVKALIFENASFLTIVGDAHGLTDGVLLADMVLLLKRRSRRKTCMMTLNTTKSEIEKISRVKQK
jgi:hypothetical protein